MEKRRDQQQTWRSIKSCGTQACLLATLTSLVVIYYMGKQLLFLFFDPKHFQMSKIKFLVRLKICSNVQSPVLFKWLIFLKLNVTPKIVKFLWFVYISDFMEKICEKKWLPSCLNVDKLRFYEKNQNRKILVFCFAWL